MVSRTFFCVCDGVHVHVEARDSPLYCFEHCLSLHLELAELAKMAGQSAPGMHLSLSLMLETCVLPCPGFYTGAGDLNSPSPRGIFSGVL